MKTSGEFISIENQFSNPPWQLDSCQAFGNDLSDAFSQGYEIQQS